MLTVAPQSKWTFTISSLNCMLAKIFVGLSFVWTALPDSTVNK